MRKMIKRYAGVLKPLMSRGIFLLLSFLFIYGCANRGGNKANEADDETNGSGNIDNCEPRMVYGPQPCESNQQCVEQNGEGWYCNLDHSYGDDGCGNELMWPVCEQSE